MKLTPEQQKKQGEILLYRAVRQALYNIYGYRG